MFAVIKTGGKQYKVTAGQELMLEKLAGEAGEAIQFNEVLMLGGEQISVGAPLIDGAAVQAEILEQTRGEKTLSLKRRRRKHSSRRLKGHRQYLTKVRVTEILASGGDATGVKAALGAGSVPREAAAAAAVETASAPVKAEKPVAESQVEAPKEAAPEPAPEPVTEAPAVPEPAEVEAVTAERPENLLTEPQGEPDDLTRISGVGPKLKNKLNENGVYHFWQIAAWGPAEIAFMDDQLSFKGRIERDNWIAQASEFAAEGEG